MKLYLMIFLYIIINIFIILSVIKFIEKYGKTLNMGIRVLALLLYLLCASTIIIGYFMPLSNIQKIIQGFANYFIGIIIYIAMAMMLFCIIILVLKISKKRNKKIERNIGLALLIFSFIFSIYGFIHAKEIVITNYEIKVSKSIDKDIKIALISDTHLGYSVGYKMIEKMVNIINKQNVDLVLIAGDIFDNSVETVDDIDKVKLALSNIKSNYGVYAVFGNHDVEERLFGGFSIQSADKNFITDEMLQMLYDSNINILDDKSILIDNQIYIIGRKDKEKAGDGSANRKKISELLEGLDKEKLIILLEHEPKDLYDTSNYDIDLHLSGHTHAGQFFPLTIGCKLMSENFYGIKKFNNMISLVSSGIGVYGPNMRVGSNSEVCILNISSNTNPLDKENYIWRKK